LVRFGESIEKWLKIKGFLVWRGLLEQLASLFFCVLGYRFECGSWKMDRRKHEQVIWESDDKYGMIDISSNP
jgi:hypothetical protein